MDNFPPDIVELEFRDGKRQVPGHLAPFLRKLDNDGELFKLTYEQAVARVNGGFMHDFLTAQGDKIRHPVFMGRRW